MLNQVRSLDDERCCTTGARLFMNQLHNVESAIINEQNVVVGAEAPPPPPPGPGPVEPANVNIVNEYNSFNLATCDTTHCSQMEGKWNITRWLSQV